MGWLADEILIPFRGRFGRLSFYDTERNSKAPDVLLHRQSDVSRALQYQDKFPESSPSSPYQSDKLVMLFQQTRRLAKASLTSPLCNKNLSDYPLSDGSVPSVL